MRLSAGTFDLCWVPEAFIAYAIRCQANRFSHNSWPNKSIVLLFMIVENSTCSGNGLANILKGTLDIYEDSSQLPLQKIWDKLHFTTLNYHPFFTSPLNFKK